MLGFKKFKASVSIYSIYSTDIILSLSSTDTDGLVSQAILTGNFEAAVEMCLHDDRMADAILLAIAGGPELLASTQRKYFKKTKSHTSRVREIVRN